MALNLFMSQKFRRLSFLGMITVVYVHAFNFDDRYLWPGRPFIEDLNFENFLQVFITNGLLRFGVPLFFFRAGFLMAETDDHYTFGSRALKKLKTLVMPYVAWGLIAVLVTYFFESQGFLNQFVISAQLGKFGVSVHEWDFGQWMSGLLGDQISFQLWFLRSLFIYSLLYPLLVKGTQKLSWILISIATVFWLTGLGLFIIEGEGLLFFTLGLVAWKKQWDLGKISDFANKYQILLLGILVAGVKTWLAFEDDYVATEWWLHRLQQPLLLVGFWALYDFSFGKITTHTWVDKASRYNFFIYGFHVPILYYLTDLSFYFLGRGSMTRLEVFIFLPLLLIAFSMLCGWIIDKIFPKLFWVLTGGRS